MKRYIVTGCAFRTKKEAVEYSNLLRATGKIGEKYLGIHHEKVVKRDNGEYWTAPEQERDIFTDIFGWDGEEVSLRKFVDGKLFYEN